MSTETMIAVIVALVAIAVAAWIVFQRQRTHNLKAKFGPEYDRVLRAERHPRRAEAILEKRQQRVAKYRIRPLTREEAERFALDWRIAQQSFVDDPKFAVAQADALVHDALRLKGYPMSDFEGQAADLSVDHPRVVEHYRAAHEIAQRDQRSQASTEDLRVAMQHYRSLFEEVLNTNLVEVNR
jgi:hypothetical protein